MPFTQDPHFGDPIILALYGQCFAGIPRRSESKFTEGLGLVHSSHDLTSRRARLLSCLALAVALAVAVDAHAVIPRKDKPAANPTKSADDTAPDKADKDKTKPSVSQPAKGPVAKVEVFIPSLVKLGHSAAESHAGAIYRALSGTLVPPVDETTDGFDFAALLKLVEEVRTWPDTSLALAIYTQDTEGRPRWVVRTDWPIAALEARIKHLLETDEAKKLLKGVQLRRDDEGRFVIELPDTVLAVLRKTDDGTLIASADKVELPESVFGIKTDKAARTRGDKSPPLCYCRVNVAAADEEGQSSWLSSIGGIRDIRYQGGVMPDGDWNERLTVSWSPLAGALKLFFKRVKTPFQCPKDAFAVAAINTDFGGSSAEGLAGLPSGTFANQAQSDFAVSVTPGVGFFPIPDIYYSFGLKNKDKAVEAIRKHLSEAAEKRADDDLPPAWKEIESETGPIFASIPGADGATGISLSSGRKVVFFDIDRDGDKEISRLVIAQTSTLADDAVAHWKSLRRRGTTKVPDSPDAHWQARISWRLVYGHIEPYVMLFTSFAENAKPLPSVDELADALTDSVLNIRIEATGVRIVHDGPIPAGAFFVPSMVAEAVMSEGDPSSEAERERIACRHLRVLYHHAKLFKKDYGRWPATVAELDGYVDFMSHPDLLWLPEQKRGFMAGLVSTVTGGREFRWPDRDKIDDSLYEIDWSPNEWKLKYRAGEFRDHKTILIDDDGEIHREPLPSKKDKVARVDSKEN